MHKFSIDTCCAFLVDSFPWDERLPDSLWGHNRKAVIMATKTMESNFTGMFDQAMQAFNETFKAGVKMQEDIAKWWADTLDQTGPAQDWQRRTRAILNDAIPATQKNAE